MREIRLHGKHAVGEHQVTLVDDVDYHWLSQWRWKAKPNGAGTHVYAVRNVVEAGKNRTVRMHREIVGLSKDDPRDIDHINHNTLDNQKSNLRAVTRSVNCQNSKPVSVSGICDECGSVFVQRCTAKTAHTVKFCSEDCKHEAHRNRAKAYARANPHKTGKLFSTVYFGRCDECGCLFTKRHRNHSAFCSVQCFDRLRSRGRPRDAVAESPCPVCGKQFVPIRNTRKYCSKPCNRKADKLRKRGLLAA